MSYGLQLSLAVLAAALIGSIPFSFFIARFIGGIDLRQHGSGNVGATNVARTMGAKWGVLALFLDGLKGAIPALILPQFLTEHSTSLFNETAICGAAAVVGHMFPPWLGFQGGKGVATALGVISVLAPAATGCAVLAFLLTFFLFRIVSLASIVGSITYCAAEFLLRPEKLFSSDSWGIGVFAIAIPLLIIVRHRSNLRRLWLGQEAKLQLKKQARENEKSSPV